MRRHHMDRVLIAGAGPTGLTAALELSRLGIPVRIIDKQSAPPTTSRAVGVQARTLELLELRGLADEMVRLGNPGLAASFYGGGKRVFRLDFTRIDSRYHYLLFISQAETERILRTAVEKQGVRIERGVELVGLAQDVLSHDPNPVRVVLYATPTAGWSRRRRPGSLAPRVRTAPCGPPLTSRSRARHATSSTPWATCTSMANSRRPI